MKNIFKVFVIFFVVTSQIFSQSDSVKTTLTEIIVSATKTATPYYAIGSSVSVIASEDIQRRQSKTVADVIRDIPGLTVVQQGGPGKLTNVTMRGANSNHTLVILDGVKMNDPSSPNNAFDFSALNTREIDRIEVVRGPQSTLYGSDAIAGLINIITKKGDGKPSFSFEGEGGTNKYYRGSVSANGAIEKLHYSIVASQSATDGISAANSIYGNTERDGNTNTSFSSRLDYDFNSKLKAGLIYKFLKAKTDLDHGEKFGDDPNYTYKQEEHIVKANIAGSFFDGVLEQNISVSHLKRFAHALDLVDAEHPSTSSDGFNNSYRFKLDWQNIVKAVPNNLITFGVETETESAATSYISSGPWGPYESLFPRESIRNNGIYLQNQLNVENELFVTAGLRFDNNQKFGSITTYRIAPVYFIASTQTKIKATYGNGFKAPSLFNLFDPAFGNPNLKPEKSKGLDFGIEQYFGRQNYFIGFTYFNLNLTDMLGYDSNFRTINIAKAKTNGFEITCSAEPSSKLSLSANYTFTETKDESEKSIDFGKQLLRRPKHQFNLSSNIKLIEELNLNMALRYIGKREDKDFGAFPSKRVTMQGYLLVNFAASYQLFNSFSLNARIENLFDKKYEEVLFYGTLGRSLYVGFNFNL
ncbi:MAG: TonB-dependent receptor [Ignavibacteria bacterium]|nr:MAG: TonB-dependent receptor [Ignavibacteria bacterium]KAF0160457.1 MAG: TonB-dependent receptor [Ignavibacteria bacterium]